MFLSSFFISALGLKEVGWNITKPTSRLPVIVTNSSIVYFHHHQGRYRLETGGKAGSCNQAEDRGILGNVWYYRPKRASEIFRGAQLLQPPPFILLCHLPRAWLLPWGWQRLRKFPRHLDHSRQGECPPTGQPCLAQLNPHPAGCFLQPTTQLPGKEKLHGLTRSVLSEGKLYFYP